MVERAHTCLSLIVSACVFGSLWPSTSNAAEEPSPGPTVTCGEHLNEATCTGLRNSLANSYPSTLGTMEGIGNPSIKLGRMTVEIETNNSPELISLLKLPDARLIWKGDEYVYGPSDQVIRLNGLAVRLIQSLMVAAMRYRLQLPYMDGNSIEFIIKAGPRDQAALSLGAEGPQLLPVRNDGHMYLPSDQTYAKAFAAAAGSLPKAKDAAKKGRGGIHKAKASR